MGSLPVLPPAPSLPLASYTLPTLPENTQCWWPLYTLATSITLLTPSASGWSWTSGGGNGLPLVLEVHFYNAITSGMLVPPALRPIGLGTECSVGAFKGLGPVSW